MTRVHTMPDGQTWVHAGEVEYTRKRDGQRIKLLRWSSWCAVCLIEIEATTPESGPKHSNALFKKHCDEHKGVSIFAKRVKG